MWRFSDFFCSGWATRDLGRHRGHLRKHLQVLLLLFCFYNGSKAGESGSGEHQQSLSVNLLQPGPQVLEEGNGALRAQRWVWKFTMQNGICYSDARVCSPVQSCSQEVFPWWGD